MNIVNITLGVDTQPCSSITLGRRGENEVTQVVVDFSSWAEEFGTGVITLLAMRSQDTSAYPVVLTLDGNTATWDVTSTDTAFKGGGRAEYIYTVGNQIAKSVVFSTVVLQDIGEPSETPPDPYEDWLERLTELGAETQANAEAAQQSAEDAEQSAQEAAESAASVEGAVEQAEAARDAARAAQAASESARDAAQTAQASAEASATAASGSAASAAGSASDASASASAASASATTASTAATAAQTAQSAAEDAADDAQQAAQQAHVEYEQLSGEVDDLSDEVSQQKSAIEDLQALTNRKAGMLVDSASGPVASFVSDATIENLLGVTVAVEPVQDLHGYDSPWPAGGGKNKIYLPAYSEDDYLAFSALVNPSVDAANQTITMNCAGAGQTVLFRKYNYPVGQYTISFTVSAYNKRAIVRCFDANETILTNQDISVTGGTWNAFYKGWYLSGDTFTVPSGADHFWIGFGVADDVRNTQVILSKIQLELGSTATSYAPYSNLCPISGWDAVEVSNTSTNIWDEQWEVGGYAGANGQPWNTTDRIRSKADNYISVLPNTAYYFKTPQNTNVCFYDANKVHIGTRTYINEAFTTPANAYYMRFACQPIYGTTYNNDISINYPATDHDYHPYAGNRYVIQLGQTVYGGTLTIAEDGSVTALVDRAKVTFTGADSENWTLYATYPNHFQIVVSPPNKKNASISETNAISNAYTARGGMSNNNSSVQQGVFSADGNRIRVKDTTCATVAEFKAKLQSLSNGLQVCYVLATPITITLDPVTISTISGQTNNLWSDAGDVTVEFAADIKAYIDRLNQPIEEDMVANNLIAANKYFTVNNRLFLSTASIAAGAMIIPGTNCTETSLAAALNALNA